MIELPLLLSIPNNQDFDVNDENQAIESINAVNRVARNVLYGFNEVDDLLDAVNDSGQNPDEYIDLATMAISRVMNDPYLLNQ